mgnify:FL=1
MLEYKAVANRRDCRVLALQVLFESDLVRHRTSFVTNRMLQNTAISPDLRKFAIELIKNVLENLAEVDNIITGHANDWPINQIAVVDLNILRMAISEIVWGKDAPSGAVINEAIELSKVFGSEGSSRFVNGVLGSFMKGRDIS